MGNCFSRGHCFDNYEQLAAVPGATGVTDAKKTDAAVFEKPQERETTGEAQLNLTNAQIFKLEKWFLYQRDPLLSDAIEFARRTGLTTAQVTVWFENRRVKWRNDMEELKRDMKTLRRDFQPWAVQVSSKSWLGHAPGSDQGRDEMDAKWRRPSSGRATIPLWVPLKRKLGIETDRIMIWLGNRRAKW